tara:strand:- start:476 stop:631 length:156 start_codon:yes stop_codon:yes gene_type:complete
LSYSQCPDTNSDGDEYAAIKLAHKKFLKVEFWKKGLPLSFKIIPELMKLLK